MVEVENMVKSFKRLKLVPIFDDFTANSILLETYFVTCTCVINAENAQMKVVFQPHCFSKQVCLWFLSHVSSLLLLIFLQCPSIDCAKNVFVYLILFHTQILCEFIIMLVLFVFFWDQWHYLATIRHYIDAIKALISNSNTNNMKNMD